MPDTFDIDRTLDSAIARHQAGDSLAAEALYRQVLAADPDNVEALNLIAVVLQDKGLISESLELITQALQIEPDFPEAAANLARGLNLLKQPGMALTASQRAIELDPDLAEGWMQLGVAQLSLGRYAEALASLRTAAVTYPDSVDLCTSMALAAEGVEDHITAERAWGDVLRHQPDMVMALIKRGAALSYLERHDEALALHREAMEIDPDSIDAQRALAMTLARRREPREVLTFCRGILEQDPENVSMMVLMGTAHTMLGQFAEARAFYEKILTLEPDHLDASRRLTLLTGDAVSEDSIGPLQARFDDPAMPVEERTSAGFLIARNRERSRDYDGAFEMYQRANGLALAAANAAGKGFDKNSLPAYLDWARRVFTPALFAEMRPWGNDSEQPVFVVGMPRSGTSLVEQIAASHPLVHGAGERKEFLFLLDRLKEGTASEASPATWDRDKIRAEAADHAAFLVRQGRGAIRTVDKMPDNIQLLGQIFLLFPNARVMVCRRDPRDVCFSCFATNFTDGIHWSHTIEDCATRAVQIDDLTRFWLSVVPGRVLEVQYEELVADLETQSRRLIDFLGLEWDPACLEFHKTERPVVTASFWQVRQPLYDTSVGRWRRYEAHLEPMLKILSGSPTG